MSYDAGSQGRSVSWRDRRPLPRHRKPSEEGRRCRADRVERLPAIRTLFLSSKRAEFSPLCFIPRSAPLDGLTEYFAARVLDTSQPFRGGKARMGHTPSLQPSEHHQTGRTKTSSTTETEWYRGSRSPKSRARCPEPAHSTSIALAIETGLRRGEMLALRWTAVLLPERSLTVAYFKNGSARTIPLTRHAVEVLAKLPRTSPMVFPMSPNALRLAWERIRRRAGCPDLHFHDLRHEAISRFFEMGLTTPEVASISGHRDIRMLMRYAHPMRQRIIEQMDKGEPKASRVNFGASYASPKTLSRNLKLASKNR